MSGVIETQLGLAKMAVSCSFIAQHRYVPYANHCLIEMCNYATAGLWLDADVSKRGSSVKPFPLHPDIALK